MARRGIEIARKLRRDMSEAERRLWSRLRDRSLGGFKFRRQVAIGPFVADFVCAERRLIVEVDGGQHADRSVEDAERTRRLGMLGYAVVRYWNNDVLANTDGVLINLLHRLNEVARAPHPGPLPRSGERE
jgi:very-short-patch-repair endonuclease